MNTRHFCLILFLSFVLAACGASVPTEPANPTDQPTAVLPTPAPTEAATSAPTEAATSADVEQTPTEVVVTLEPDAPIEPATPTLEQQLVGSKWYLHSADNFTPATNAMVSIEFGEDNQLFGTGGCNGFFATYQFLEQQLAVRDIGSTEMACETGMDEEIAFLDTLNQAESIILRGDALTIMTANGALHFAVSQPEVAVQPSDDELDNLFDTMPVENENSPLAGQWVLSMIAIQDMAFAPIESARAWIQFDEALSGNTGCNPFSGSYETANGELVSVTNGAVSARACLDELSQEQERNLLDILFTATGFVQDGNQLIVKSADRTLLFDRATEPINTTPVDDSQPPEDQPNEAVETLAVDPFIEDFRITINATDPVTAEIWIKGSLPNGCANITGLQQKNLDNNTIELKVLAEMEAGQICTQALVPFEQTWPFDLEGLTSGDYTVIVNNIEGFLTLVLK